MRIGTNSIYEVKITIHFVQFYKFLVRFFVKDMIMGNNTTDYTSMDEKYFFIMISYVIKPLNIRFVKWLICSHFRKNRNESEYDKKLIKCKECEMKFDHKDRLLIHNKKAHSGRGERKKNT